MNTVTSVDISLNDIELTPGSMITIHGVTWEKFEAILGNLGEKRSTRIVYLDGTLEIMSPLPIHERPHRIIGYIVTALLDAEGREWEDFGSTTLRRQKKAVGLEPDTCFYIQNAERVRNCLTEMDLELYPPPDLAIESDVTSRTLLAVYQRLQVPEVWVYERALLKIYLLQNGGYLASSTSLIFPNQPITTLIPQLVQQALQHGTSKMLRDFRQRLIQ